MDEWVRKKVEGYNTVVGTYLLDKITRVYSQTQAGGQET